jgi:hypothetical protein
MASLSASVGTGHPFGDGYAGRCPRRPFPAGHFHLPLLPLIRPVSADALGRSEGVPVVASKKLPVQKRKEVFLALVAAQDTHTMSIADTQRQVQLDFAITPSQLEEIIEEGVEKEWLDEEVAA